MQQAIKHKETRHIGHKRVMSHLVEIFDFLLKMFEIFLSCERKKLFP